MALAIPSYPNRYDPATPLVEAYAWISGLALDASSLSGRLTLNIHPSAAAAEVAPPIEQIQVSLGEVLAEPEGEPVAFPTLAELMANSEFATAYGTIRAILEAQLVAKHPALAGSTPA